MIRAAYPGSFNPPTVAHLAIAEAARAQCGVDRVTLVLSRSPLGKEGPGLVALDDRLAVLDAVAASRPWLAVAVSERRLIAEIVTGYDVVVLGADKWAQVTDPAWYGGDPARRDAVVAGLPRLALAPRAGAPPAARPLPADAVVLAVDETHLDVSASAARAGRSEWMLAEARRAGHWSGPSPFTPGTD